MGDQLILYDGETKYYVTRIGRPNCNKLLSIISVGDHLTLELLAGSKREVIDVRTEEKILYSKDTYITVTTRGEKKVTYFLIIFFIGYLINLYRINKSKYVKK